jgi:uncharacterized membrane protein YedE/YeeE
VALVVAALTVTAIAGICAYGHLALSVALVVAALTVTAIAGICAYGHATFIVTLIGAHPKHITVVDAPHDFVGPLLGVNAHCDLNG